MRKKLVLVSMVLLISALLSGCAGGPIRGATWAGLAAVDNTAYLADGTFVFAINLENGKEIWHYPASRDSKLLFYTTPVITPDGLVIVGSSGTNRSLIALNPNDIDSKTKSPIEAWIFHEAEDNWVAAPLVVNDKLFAVNADGNLYILDLQDGQSNKTAVKIKLDGRLWAQPITDGQPVFITSLDHSVIAVDVETYKILWHEDLKGAIPGSVVLGTDGTLYVGSLASQIEKFDPATGKHQPILTAEGWIWGTPSMEGDNLYFGDLTGSFYSFNVKEGINNWGPVSSVGAITASPIILSDYILVATETGGTEESPGNIFAISREGEILWDEEVGGKIYTTPVAAGELILVAPLGADAYLYAYDLDGHEASWSPFTPED